MAMSMMDKSTDRAEKSAWPPAIAAEFERERQNNNGCVGTTLLSESDRVRVWIIRLAPRRADRLSPPCARLFLDIG